MSSDDRLAIGQQITKAKAEAEKAKAEANKAKAEAEKAKAEANKAKAVADKKAKAEADKAKAEADKKSNEDAREMGWQLPAEEVACDVLIGADRIHSAVLAQLYSYEGIPK